MYYYNSHFKCEMALCVMVAEFQSPEVCNNDMEKVESRKFKNAIIKF